MYSADECQHRGLLRGFVHFLAELVEKAAAGREKRGECEEKCSYGLPILEMMDESIALYRREKARYDLSADYTDSADS